LEFHNASLSGCDGDGLEHPIALGARLAIDVSFGGEDVGVAAVTSTHATRLQVEMVANPVILQAVGEGKS
jgi:hypothetical protein